MAVLLAGTVRADGPRPPSVLVILSDDQRADTIQALGNPHLRTPAVDALVARGTVFDRAYCMGSMQAAVCVPSRAMMLSGRSLFRIDEQLRGCDTWPEAFARAGHRTFLTGKWHNGAASASRCFAEGRNVFLGGMHNQFGVPVVSFTDHGQPVKAEPARTHSSELFGDAAEAFVQSLGDEPFFAWVAFTAPHDPRQPPEGFRERFAGQEPPPPKNFLPEHPFDNGELKVRDEKLLGWPRSREQISAALADYYACIEGMDAQIARVVAALEAKGRLDDTIILFTSDHGLALGSHGLLGKQNLYEHSMRPPAVIAGPGVPAGRRTDALCYLHDLTATVGDLAGVSAPEASEGKSLVPVLRDQRPGIRDELLLGYRNVQRALVTPEWKLITYPAAHKTQLFDLARDPDEIVNLADDAAVADRRTDLEARLVAARQAADDPPPVESPAAKPTGTASAPSAAAVPTGGSPNIVLIVADDFGYECVGANGGQSYRTLHLDRLAATGARFEQCHVLPLCTPTRVELMTGRSNVRNYVKFGQLPRSETTFARLLKDAGYATGICGKWQLGQEPDSPRHFGFDESYLWQHTRRPPRYANPGLEIDGVERDFRDGEYGPALVNDFAIDFVTRHKDHPFLLYYPMMLTHDPFQPTPDSDAWDPTARGEGMDRPVHFAAMVEYMDKLIGRLVARLDELGIRDNTLLVFLGDNGTSPAITSRLNGTEYRGGKGSTTVRGTHVPLVVNWPARGRAGLVTADLVGAVDVLPTLCEAAGVAVPDGGDGTSFLPQVRGKRGTPRNWIYSWFSPRLGAARKVREYAFDQRFKLYRTGEFFDLGADPDERRPLPIESLSPQAVEAARTLSAAIDHFAAARPPELDGADRASARSPEPADE